MKLITYTASIANRKPLHAPTDLQYCGQSEKWQADQCPLNQIRCSDSGSGVCCHVHLDNFGKMAVARLNSSLDVLSPEVVQRLAGIRSAALALHKSLNARSDSGR